MVYHIYRSITLRREKKYLASLAKEKKTHFQEFTKYFGITMQRMETMERIRSGETAVTART